MVAVVAGSGLGLERSSAWVLGSRGQLGSAALGRAGEQVYVNAANGNLVISNTDEMLFGLGADIGIQRSYNSQATTDWDNGDNWQAGTTRRLTGMHATYGSGTVNRTDWDGGIHNYSWSADARGVGLGGYVFREGAGAHDVLYRDPTGTGPWIWVDGTTQTKEVYEADPVSAKGWRIVSREDTDGNKITFTYNSDSLVTQVTTSSNGAYVDSTSLTYNSDKELIEIVTSYHDVADDHAVKSLTRVGYTYDTSHRLKTVTIDLTPQNTTDTATYTTTYSYADATSKLVTGIVQSDGSSISITYTSDLKVETITQQVSNGEARLTSFAYDNTNKTTTVTDPLNQVTTLTYDAAGRLKTIVRPIDGTSQTHTFYYNSSTGDPTTVIYGSNNRFDYAYDVNGNLILERDVLGNTVERVYDLATNTLRIETRYQAPDPDAAGIVVGPLPPTNPLTTRYVYDTENHLRFVISHDGRVTEYSYDAEGRRVRETAYAVSTYTMAGLGVTDQITLSTMTGWKTGADKSKVIQSDVSYDFRGNVSKVTTYSSILSTGEPDTSSSKSEVNYIYDQTGRLLSRLWSDQQTYEAETYVYDGLGRLTGWTDHNGISTAVLFYDASSTTKVQFQNGQAQVSVFNLAGELIESVREAPQLADSVTTYAYDALGRVRMVTDPTGRKSYVLYDSLGRKSADIDADGSLAEYRYNNTNDRLVATVRYKEKLSSSGLASLIGPDGKPGNVAVAALRPAVADADDRWEWRIYDKAQRLVQVIDGSGAATAYIYDSASRLISTRAYAAKISQTQLANFKWTPPLTAVTVTADSNLDRVTRNFFDADDRLIGTLDAEGYLTQIVYDGSGKLKQTVRFADPPGAASPATASFDDLVASVPANAGDIRQHQFYDARGFLIATVNGEGDVTRYEYDPRGFVTKEHRGQRIAPLGASATIADVASPTGADIVETTNYTRDAYGKVLEEIRLLDGRDAHTLYAYDDQGRLIEKRTWDDIAGVVADERVSQWRYDRRGRLTGVLNGVGAKALYDAHGKYPTETQKDAYFDKYGTTYAYDHADRLVSKSDANGIGTGQNTTLFFYNGDGLLSHAVSADGAVTEHRYNAFNQISETISYGRRLAPGTREGLLLHWAEALNEPLWWQDAATQLASAIDTIEDASFPTQPTQDRLTSYGYDVVGRVNQSSTSLLGATNYAYTTFGEEESRTDPIGKLFQRTYDRRGLLKTETRDPNGGSQQTAYTYDAFGRARTVTDPLNLVTTTTYDRAGRMNSVTDVFGSQSFTYDGRSNLITSTDRLNATTTYAYTKGNRQVTVTSPENIVTVTKRDAYGGTIEIIDGAQRSTKYQYDRDGHLTKIIVAEGSTVQEITENVYDFAGRVKETIDARGYKTSYAYDAMNRVLTRKVDDRTGGLNLTTTYGYDARSNQVSVTDPDNRVTQIKFDLAGRRTDVLQDPSGLALRTVFEYDARSRQTKVYEGWNTPGQKVTRYDYDTADRLTHVVVDPGALNLTTQYTYDKNDNVVAKTDALGKLTRYVYEGGERLIYTVDPSGAVVKNTYDAEGRVTEVRRYASAISLAGLGVAVIASDISSRITPDNAADQVTRYAFDKDGRLRFEIASLGLGATHVGHPIEYVYDGSGNVISRTAFAGAITVPANATAATVAGLITSGMRNDLKNQTARAIFDAANRQMFSIDALGRLTQYTRDGVGNIVRKVEYASSPAVAPNATWTTVQGQITSAMNSNTNNRVTRAVFDGAGRQVAAINADRAVTVYTYDRSDHVVRTTAYSVRYTGFAAVSLADVGTWEAAQANAAGNRITRVYYDAAGRAVYAVDGDGYVTKNTYDAASRLTASIQYVEQSAFTNAHTFAYVVGVVGAYSGTNSVERQFDYDAAGRLEGTRDAAGIWTNLTLDAEGRVTDSVIAQGTADAATTTYTYDAAGRLETQTRGVGDNPSTTKWTYDGVGRIKTRTAAFGETEAQTTSWTYDSRGNVKTETNALNAITTKDYDAFNNLFKIRDHTAGEGYFYYDKLNRLELQVDPEGYVTETKYTIVTATTANGVTTFTDSDTDSVGVEATRIIRYYGKPSHTPGTKPTAAPTPGEDATTRLVRDAEDRIRWLVDAEGHYEQYDYNAFGEKSIHTNKLGGETHYTYNKRGLLETEKLPEKSGGADVVNRYNYDSRGNLKQTIEAETLSESRTTNYAYTKTNLLETKSGLAFQAVTPDLTQANPNLTGANSTPTDRIFYDRRGNVRETVTAAGTRTLFWYDDLDRKVVELDAAGTFRAWTYDDNNNVTTATVYATPVSLPVGGATAQPGKPNPPTATPNDRLTTYEYDAGNRLRRTIVTSLLLGAQNGSTYQVSTGTVTVERVYDALGNVRREIDGRGNTKTYWYDKLGRMTRQLDAEGYLTSYTLDADGNVETETRFANKFTGSINLNTPPTVTADSVNDRTTTFTYDRNGRRKSETRSAVIYATVSGNSAAETSGAVTISYLYNGLGQVTQKTEGTTDVTNYGYDKMGRLTSELSASFQVINEATGLLETTPVRQQTTTTYNGLSNVVKTRVAKSGTNEGTGPERITTYAYSQGRLTSTTDATTFTRSYGYDLDGRVTKEQYSRIKSDGSSVIEANVFDYDALGRVILQTVATNTSGSTWVSGDRTHIRYNAFGEVTGKGTNVVADAYQETFDYDTGGRMWRSNAGDGSTRIYFYDANGNATLSVASAGGTALTYATASAAATGLMGTGTLNAASTANQAYVFTVGVFDKRNQNTSNIELNRQLSYNTSTSAYTTQNITTSRTFNAFGEIKSETDGLLKTTNFYYNTMGRLLKRENPLADYTLADGTVVTSVRTSQQYYYDQSGRLVGARDANDKLTTRTLLAGTGYGDDDAIVLKEHRPDTSTVENRVDVFRDVRRYVNALGFVQKRDYDKAGRLITQEQPTRADGVKLIDDYRYDGLGQRIQHWNNQLTSSVKERTDYDAQGRVVSYVAMGGDTTTYTYLWEAEITADGLDLAAASGGWKKTTLTPSGRDAVERQDYFGRVVDRQDLGDGLGRDYNFTFDKAGRLITETNGAGKNITHAYLNSGKLRSTIDAGANGVTSEFGYDKLGRRVSEKHIKAGGIVHQNATVQYDALGRMKSYSDTGAAVGGPISIAYEYDANGNVRRQSSSWEDPSAPTTVMRSDEVWYDYDSMNRIIVTGSLSDVAGTTFDGIYDYFNGEGQKVRSSTYGTFQYEVSKYWNYGDNTWEYTYYDYIGENRTFYHYTADGYLEDVELLQSSYDGQTEWHPTTETSGGIALNRTTRDAMGRLIAYDDFTTNLNRTVVYNDKSQVVSETQISRYSDNRRLHATTTYDYNLKGAGTAYDGAYQGGIVTHTKTTYQAIKINNASDIVNKPTSENTYTHEWWDSALTKTLNYTRSSDNWTTTHNYDGDGNLATVNIADGQPRTNAYVTDANGRILVRERTGTRIDDAFNYFFDGKSVGTITWHDGHYSTYQTNPFSYGSFRKNNHSGVEQSEKVTTYTVREGETLQSIAASLWGDASLWYIIADLNGLVEADAASAAQPEGATLQIPVNVGTVHNNSETFRVYDHANAIGDVSPTQPKPPKEPACGGMGAILLVVIAVVVTAIVAPWATAHIGQAALGLGGFGSAVVGGAIGGAAGSIVSQAVGVATGIQDEFDWKGVAMAAIGGAIGGGIAKLGPFQKLANLKALGQYGDHVVKGLNAAATSVLTQGVGVATGLQDEFDWVGVAVSAVSAGVGSYAGGALGNEHVGNFVGGIAGVGARSVIEGTSFGDNLVSALPGIVGSTIGSLLGETLKGEMELQKLRGVDAFRNLSRDKLQAVQASLAAADAIGARQPGTTYKIVEADQAKAQVILDQIAIDQSPDEYSIDFHRTTVKAYLELSGLSGNAPETSPSNASAADVLETTQLAAPLTNDPYSGPHPKGHWYTPKDINPTVGVALPPAPADMGYDDAPLTDSMRAFIVGQRFANADQAAATLTFISRNYRATTTTGTAPQFEWSAPIAKAPGETFVRVPWVKTSKHSGSGAIVWPNQSVGWDVVAGWHLHPAKSATGFMFSRADYVGAYRDRQRFGPEFELYLTSRYDPLGVETWSTYRLTPTIAPDVLFAKAQALTRNELDGTASIDLPSLERNRDRTPIAYRLPMFDGDGDVGADYNILGSRVSTSPVSFKPQSPVVSGPLAPAFPSPLTPPALEPITVPPLAPKG